MKWYITNGNCMGYVPSKGRYEKFETEDAYVEWYRENAECE